MQEKINRNDPAPHFDGEKEQIHASTMEGPELGVVTDRQPTAVNKTKLNQKPLSQEALEEQAIQKDALT